MSKQSTPTTLTDLGITRAGVLGPARQGLPIGLQKVKAEMALAVTAYNLTRAITVLGVPRLCQALAA